MDCFALRICEMCTRRGDFRASLWKSPTLARLPLSPARIWCLETRAERDAVLGCLALRIIEIGPSMRQFPCLTLEGPYFGALTVDNHACFVLRDVIRAGCSAGLPRIAYYRNWALDSAISRRRLEDSLFWYARHGERCAAGVWRPGLSGTWRLTASHCVFVKCALDAAIFVPARRMFPFLE